LPIATDVVAHSPTPSMVSTTASSNGEGKNADAAWLRWCSANSSLFFQSKAGSNTRNFLRSRSFWKSFSLSQIGFQKAFEFKKRLVVKDDKIDLFQSDTGAGETKPDGVYGKPGIVFFTGETLFLGGGGDGAVFDQCRGTVVIKGGYPENSQQRILFRKSYR